MNWNLGNDMSEWIIPNISHGIFKRKDKMNDIFSMKEKAARDFYIIRKAVDGMKEIPDYIVAEAGRREWAFRNGYTAIGYFSEKWYALP